MGINLVLKKISMDWFFINLFDFCKLMQSATALMLKGGNCNCNLVQLLVFGQFDNQILKQ